MPAYTATEVEAIAARLLDHYAKNPPKDSATYNKPTFDRLVAKKKTFGATKGEISLPVRLTHGNAGTNDGVVGIGPGDKLNFYNPSNDRRATYTRRKHHIGIEMTEDELEDYGIEIVDEMGKTSGDSTSAHPQLVAALKSKSEDFNEQHDEKMNTLLWGDGSADSQAMAGIRSIILDNPAAGTVGGLSCALNARWRNSAYTSSSANGAITSATTGGGALIQVLQKDLRQLERYGSKVDLRPSGSDFLDALETELRANGTYYERGTGGEHDIYIDSIKIKNQVFYYDPELDNISREKYSYALCTKDLHLHVREGMWKKVRNPARPYDQFVIHKSLVTTCQLAADKLNGMAVYQIN